MDKLLSVVVPVYNVGKYLAPCINSILEQTYRNIELILVDDGSTDDSGKICDSFSDNDNRVKTIHKKNGGVSSARNTGIEKASGEYIAFVDADDQLDPDMYEILIEGMNEMNAEVSACTYKKEYDLSSIRLSNNDRCKYIKFEGTKQIYESITRNENSIEGLIWNKVYRKEIVSGHKFRTDIAIVDDAAFSWEIFKNVKIVSFISLPMYHYLIIPSSITRNSNMDKYMKALKGYELMINDARNISTKCVDDLTIQYLNWNVTAFEKLVYQDIKDIDIYNSIKHNCGESRKYYKELSLYNRIVIQSLLLSYNTGINSVKILNAVKRMNK